MGAGIGALAGFLAFMSDARIGQSFPLWQPVAAYAAVCAVPGAITG
jgi:hypothetical protein